MGITHTTAATGTDSGDGKISKNAWNEEHVATLIASLTVVIDGGGVAIIPGIKGNLRVPFACTIVRASLLADQSGSIVVDIWQNTYANYPPTDTNSITASAPPTISTATKAEDTTLTGWDVTLDEGSILRYNVDSCTSIQRVTVELKVSHLG